jgi:hypothetical protein
MADKILTERLTCKCNPGKIYASKSTFNSHKKSKRHVSYETSGQELEHRKTITKLQNKVEQLKNFSSLIEEKYFSQELENRKIIESYKNGVEHLEEKFKNITLKHEKLKIMYIKCVKSVKF